MQTHKLLVQDSGVVEWYTPPAIIEAARATMGSITLDPASCQQANKTVMADQYFTVKEDGLSRPWHGNVWMNHPYGRHENPRWVTMLLNEYWAGNVAQACALVFASTSERWFQPLYNYPICFIAGRVRHGSPGGECATKSTKGSAVVYLGYDTARFTECFRSLGRIMVPYRYQL